MNAFWEWLQGNNKHQTDAKKADGFRAADFKVLMGAKRVGLKIKLSTAGRELRWWGYNKTPVITREG